MRHANRYTPLVYVVLATSACLYLGAQWPHIPYARPALGALAMPPGSAPPTGTATTAQPDLASAARLERDPSLETPKRLPHLPPPGGDAFAPLSWLPAPKPVLAPPAAPAPPPPAPTAPPLPFTFVGLLEQGLGQPKAFLARGESLLVVAAGDTVELNYSIDSITPQLITLTYLPLKTRQTLSISGAAK